MATSDTPAWLTYVLKTRRSYIKDVKLAEGYSATLAGLYDMLRPAQSTLLGLFPVAHEDQTTFAICKETEAAIFFDVGQAAILKSAYAAMRSNDPETTVFNVFLSTASLKVSPADRFLADRLGDSWSGPYDGPPFADPQQLPQARATLARYLGADLQRSFELIVDCTITAHELYHYRAHQSQSIPEIEEVIARHYDAFVKVATEDVDTFPIKHLSEAQKLQYAKERSLKRDYYAQERRMVGEEMACDLFAFISVASLLVAQKPPNVRTRSQLELVLGLHSIVFNLHLLHLAFTERARLFLDFGLDYRLPGWMSLFNLRRVAIGVLSSEWCAGNLTADAATEPRVSDAHQDLSGEFQRLQGRVYVAMTNDLLAPAIPRLKACFSLIETSFPRADRAEPEPTEDPSERLSLSALPFRLDKGVLNRMLHGGADGLVQQVLPFLPAR